MSETMTGAQIVLKALQDQGVEHIFGYPGGAVLPIYDEIFRQDAVEHIWCATSRVRPMPRKVMRSTGKPGVSWLHPAPVRPMR